MTKRILLALLAAAALSAPADTKIATVDFSLVVLAHPQTPRNRAELLDMQAKFEKERDDRLAARDKLRDEFEAARKVALDPVQGAAARDQATAKAKDLQMQYAKTTEEIEAFVAGLRRQLQRREGELFANVMIDIRSRIEEIAKAKMLFDAKVDVTELMGAEIYLYVTIAGQSITARVAPTSTAKVGDDIKVCFSLDKLHIFDKDTEQIITN